MRVAMHSDREVGPWTDRLIHRKVEGELVAHMRAILTQMVSGPPAGGVCWKAAAPGGRAGKVCWAPRPVLGLDEPRLTVRKSLGSAQAPSAVTLRSTWAALGVGLTRGDTQAVRRGAVRRARAPPLPKSAPARRGAGPRRPGPSGRPWRPRRAPRTACGRRHGSCRRSPASNSHCLDVAGAEDPL